MKLPLPPFPVHTGISIVCTFIPLHSFYHFLSINIPERLRSSHKKVRHACTDFAASSSAPRCPISGTPSWIPATSGVRTCLAPGRGLCEICSGVGAVSELPLQKFVSLFRIFFAPSAVRSNNPVANEQNVNAIHNLQQNKKASPERTANKLVTLLDLCVSSLHRGHANLLCIVPIYRMIPEGIHK